MKSVRERGERVTEIMTPWHNPEDFRGRISVGRGAPERSVGEWGVAAGRGGAALLPQQPRPATHRRAPEGFEVQGVADAERGAFERPCRDPGSLAVDARHGSAGRAQGTSRSARMPGPGGPPEAGAGGSGSADVIAGLSALGARYLQENVADGSVVGVNWSSTVYHVVSARYLREKSNVTVVQLMGSIGGSIAELDGVSVTARLADAWAR